MTQISSTLDHRNAISASWSRCRQKHKLARHGARPILRLQSSEVTPRLESILDRTSGCQGIFDQLANSAANTGNCLILTDENGILVRMDSKQTYNGASDWNGIALGSCWDERIAGTNGVSMALTEGRAFTVRGQDHFFSKLSQFSCTATPLLDAANQIIGVLNLASIDHGNAADYLFAKQLLDVAADHIQRNLFEKKFQDVKIVSLSMPDHRYLFRRNEMVAVNEEGIILGSTSKAHNIANMGHSTDLIGQVFEQLFEADISDLQVPERVMGVTTNANRKINIQAHIRKTTRTNYPKNIQKPANVNAPQKSISSRRHRLAPSFNEMVVGSKKMECLCERSSEYFHRAIPFVIEGASGTGKSALVAALHDEIKVTSNRALTIDCATLGTEEDDRNHFRNMISQARAIDSLTLVNDGISTIIFDNIDELPQYAQAELRNLLNEIEMWSHNYEHSATSSLRIIATCKKSLKKMVADCNFRDDLYYLLAGTVIRLPSICERENPDKLIQAIAEKIVGAEVEVTDEALIALERYDWPGNVRQLRSVLKQALVESDGRRISLLNLLETPVVADSPQDPAHSRQPILAKTLKYDEQTLLIDALESARWNISEAARSLGIGRATVHRKMKRYGIRRPD